ncbi:hypothetical protein IGS68_35095 (plasmid) [Skermanella sp. TT6]|uniref:Uncharacterized protein n=1 Tax=Skermanella cutis TaxID=2775420 RepID=A0ABX7BLH0_9PROT|nr:hypothetical protein [Skermanella sp. TT6]QQP94039.1 hypothetical protein IGS68_35095 [Skermanella sp. TT6]
MKAKGIENQVIDVTVQLGYERWSTRLTKMDLLRAIEDFEHGPKPRRRKDRLRPFSHEGVVLASFRLLLATATDDARGICVAAAWMAFRRPGELHYDYPITRLLGNLLSEDGAARLVIVADECATLQSFSFQAAPQGTLDAELDLTPRTTIAHSTVH